MVSLLRFSMRFLGIVAIFIAVWAIQDQVVPGWWRWDQALQLSHHESTALMLLIIAPVLFWFSFGLRRRKEKHD